MSEYIDPDDGLFTPIGAPKLALSKRLPSMFKSGAYPTQIEGWLPGFAGEQRGFFANNRWRPSWSAFHHRRGSATGRHGGVDVFASSGTPLLAVVDGELSFIPDDGNAIGNRAHLVFNDSGLRWRFIYGHLHSFNGANRSVLKGDVIGLPGCTGNAGGGQPCSVANSCGKFSTHVHFMLVRDQDNMRFDPTEALSWKLRYQDDKRDVPCNEVV